MTQPESRTLFDEPDQVAPEKKPKARPKAAKVREKRES